MPLAQTCVVIPLNPLLSRSRTSTLTVSPMLVGIKLERVQILLVDFWDYLQACCRVSCRKLAQIDTNPYAQELLSRKVDFHVESNETYSSIVDTAVTHMGNIGVMLMDEAAHINKRIDACHEEIKKLERSAASIDRLKGEVITLKDLVWGLIDQTGRLEDNQVHLTLCVSELTGEVRDLQRRCQGEEFVVPVEGRLVPINDEVIEIHEEESYRNIRVVCRDTPRPCGRGLTPLITVIDPTLSRNQWPALEFNLYAKFVPDSEPNSDTTGDKPLLTDQLSPTKAAFSANLPTDSLTNWVATNSFTK
ncbi:hypothetical protein BJ322DRAFT_1113213 [Thelephora terrestris]|uniref:Uncharacterized protein n=1 Tax=Thelephora terrestris TaxID=56493 RepID=A0A9P6H6A3_9AGAM|nr:hypothetical protein BJ322DRAFT_1113213 [Thelephora terrestris]